MTTTIQVTPLHTSSDDLGHLQCDLVGQEGMSMARTRKAGNRIVFYLGVGMVTIALLSASACGSPADSVIDDTEGETVPANDEPPCESASGCSVEDEPLISLSTDEDACSLDSDCDAVTPDPIAPSSDCDAGDGCSAATNLSASVSDPVGDLVPAFDGVDGIDGSREVDGETGEDVMEAGDLTGMEVVSNSEDAVTEVTLDFNGSAQAIQEGGNGNLTDTSLSADVLIYLHEGRVLNVLFRNDGKIKISDIPEGMSITSEWVTPEQLQIIILGLSLSPYTRIEAHLLLEAYGGFMSDVVTLALSGS